MNIVICPTEMVAARARRTQDIYISRDRQVSLDIADELARLGESDEAAQQRAAVARRDAMFLDTEFRTALDGAWEALIAELMNDMCEVADGNRAIVERHRPIIERHITENRHT